MPCTSTNGAYGEHILGVLLESVELGMKIADVVQNNLDASRCDTSSTNSALGHQSIGRSRGQQPFVEGVE